MHAKTIKKKRATQIALYIVILFLLVGSVGFFAYFTNGFTSDFTTFYVEVNGEQYLKDASGFIMTVDEPITFDVGYTFDKVDDDIKGYSVKVVPNVTEENDFTFTIDGEDHKYSEVTELTKGFDIEKTDTSFTITPKGSVTKMLQQIYPDSNIEDCATKGYDDMFTLVITSYNGASSIKINFTVIYELEGIVLSREVIHF